MGRDVAKVMSLVLLAMCLIVSVMGVVLTVVGIKRRHRKMIYNGILMVLTPAVMFAALGLLAWLIGRAR
jgi:hypothetical protein